MEEGFHVWNEQEAKLSLA